MTKYGGSPVREQDLQRAKRWIKMKNYRFLYLLLSFALVYTLIFCYLPIGGVIMAFQKFNIVKGFFGSEFVGVDNFIKVLTMPKFLDAIKNTLVYSSVNLFLGMPFPILFAIMLNELRYTKFKRTIQTISYLPHFLSWISVIGMFYTMFARDGIYNNIIIQILGEGYPCNNILMDHKNFLSVIFWSARWKELGWSSIIYLAAISSIDPSLYEAAVVDGCRRFRQIIHITIPSIAPTILIIFIMAMGSLVQSNFTQVYGFQNLYTQEFTETIATIAYRQGIQGGQYSLTTALGFMQGLISFALVFFSNSIVKKMTGTGIW